MSLVLEATIFLRTETTDKTGINEARPDYVSIESREIVVQGSIPLRTTDLRDFMNGSILQNWEQ
jgi:hypothetical protein